MSPLGHDRWQVISPYLDRALEMAAAERSLWLELLRAEDPALAHDLQALLAERSALSREGFLEGTAPLPPQVTLHGQTVGAYTLVSPLGQGGMGSVWLARRSDGRFEGLAAVKLLNPSLVSTSGAERFKREGNILARLTHPHVAHLIDAGVSPTGQPYLVLEHVEGERIDRYCDQRGLPVDARIRLFLDVLGAVAHAHANLIVHRDIKPSNVLVSTGGQVKLLDFGIAKLLESEARAGEATALTREGGGALTPEYAAPEQVTGGPVTTATDVYSLGVLLYVLLGGRHPTGSALETPADLLRAIVDTEPPRVSDAGTARRGSEGIAEIAAQRATSPRKLQAALRGDLDNILAKALKKQPSERYASAEAMADDLKRYLDHRPVRARADSLGYRARKFVVRNRLSLGAAAIVAIALATGAGVAARQARVSARERDRALMQLRRAEATNSFNSFLLQEATPSSGRPLTNAELLERADALIDRRFARDPELRAHMLLILAARYNENRQFDRWQATLDRAFSLSRGFADVELRARAACAKAEGLADQGRFDDADKLIGASLRDLSALPDALSGEAACRVSESTTASLRGDGARAMSAAQRAVKLEAARKGPAGSGFEALYALATAYLVADRTADASRSFRELIAMLEAQGLERTRDAASVLSNWSVMLGRAGQYAEALPIAQRAVAIMRERDTEHGAGSTELLVLGNALGKVGRNAEAIPIFEESVEKARTGGSPRRVLAALMLMATAYREAGDFDRAARALNESEATLKVNPGEAQPGQAALLEGHRARLALARGHSGEALALARHALERHDDPASTNHDILSLTLVLAETQIATGDLTGAGASARRALALANELLGGLPYSWQMGQARLQLGIALLRQGNVQEGRKELKLALDDLRRSVGPDAPSTRQALSELERLQSIALP